MISFHSQNDFELNSTFRYREWLNARVNIHGMTIRSLNYVFCDDAYLLEINKQFLNHDTFTDIISFDYSSDGMIEGEIYISTERVAENAVLFDVPFEAELNRVISHGLLHLLGYKDKTEDEQQEMRAQENEMMEMFHVKQ
jgi:rRNA maturation RNase YbeY